MPLSDLCKMPVVTLPPDEKVMKAAEMMAQCKVGAIVIAEQERPVGMLTDRDILIRVVAQRRDPSATLIREVMTPDPAVATEESGVLDLIRLMKKRAVRRLPVLSAAGKLTGIISMDDIVEILGEELSALGRTVWSQEEPMRERKA